MFFNALAFTYCLSILAESTPEKSPVKTRPVKSIPSEKSFGVHSGGNAKSLAFLIEFLNFAPMSFDINPVILLRQSLFSSRASLGLRKSAVTFFLKCWIELLWHKGLIFICFYWLFMMSLELDVIYLTIPLNESKKLIDLWQPEIYLCKMYKNYNAEVSFIWSYMHINFLLVKFCFSYFGTMHCMRAEYFNTILIATIDLLECLNKSTETWRFLRAHWRDPWGRFLLLYCGKVISLFSFCLYYILFLYVYYYSLFLVVSVN